MSAYKALLFDSGVGGLSILQALQEHCPALSMYYLADNAAYPYGTKNDSQLQQRIVQVCQKAVEHCQPDILIIACNTASTLALDSLRSVLTIPVVGVVPAIKVAAEHARQAQHQGHRAEVGLLATQATVNRRYIDDLCDNFAHDIKVNRFGSHQLVELAERFVQGQVIQPELFNHLQPWIEQNADMRYIVLGCTHFPLLRPELERNWPHISWIDSGEAIARRVMALLGNTPDHSSQFEAPAQGVSVLLTDHSLPQSVTAFLDRQKCAYQVDCAPFTSSHHQALQHSSAVINTDAFIKN